MTAGRLLWGAILPLLLLGLLPACTTLRLDVDKPESMAIPADPASPLGRLAAARLAGVAPAGAGTDESAFRLLESGRAALSARLALIEQARDSIDLQVYIFHADASGRLVAAALLRAADRGARVRVLIDDMHTAAHEPDLSGLDVHPNIEIRLYNPFNVRGNAPLGRLAEFVGDSDRLTRRMHNKIMVVDNQFGIAGGRNIGDEYFQLEQQRDFLDLDVLAAGKVVNELSAAFDAYWNAEPSVPADALPRFAPRLTLLDRARAALERHETDIGPRLSDYLGLDALGASAGEGFGPWSSGRAELLLDPPDKVSAATPAKDLPAVRLMNLGLEARRELLIASPYFVPGQLGLDLLRLLRGRGAEVAVLTNSLAANDVVVAHAGYARYRVPLLVSGVRLHELKPLKQKSVIHQILGSGSSRASLHGKAVVFDREAVYIGSMNLDPRSVLLNTESGLIIRGEGFAGQVAAVIDRAMSPEKSWRVRLAPDARSSEEALRWQETVAGREITHEREPRAGFWLRLLVDFFSGLPIEGSL